MKNIKKIFVKILIIGIMFNIISFLNYEVNAGLIDDIISQSTDFINKGSNGAESFGTAEITSDFKQIGQLLTYIGGGVLVAVVSYLGINYLISPPDKQAMLKQQLIGVVVSGVVIFGAYGIWKAILGIVSSF